MTEIRKDIKTERQKDGVFFVRYTRTYVLNTQRAHRKEAQSVKKCTKPIQKFKIKTCCFINYKVTKM